MSSISRRAVLERLAAASDADRGEATTIDALASELDADRPTIEAHLEGLAACQLVRLDPDERARVTITGEELLALDIDDVVIVDPSTMCPER